MERQPPLNHRVFSVWERVDQIVSPRVGAENFPVSSRRERCVILGARASCAVARRADLILLNANPLRDIAHSQRISDVVVNGRWIGSAERAQMLARLAAH
ncbi:MAG: hypothetical protein WD802_08310 [Gemmatimonadaceae bacterium]